MQAQFDDLKKIPPEPAARILARCDMKLTTPVKAPPAAPVSEVLEELAGAGAWMDVLLLLAAALPPREAAWWGCLAGRDIVGPVKGKDVPLPLAAAEAWVFQPTHENRVAVQRALNAADSDDDTVYPAMAALYGDGSLGVGDLEEMPAPANGVATMVLTMNMISAQAHADIFEMHLRHLAARGIDIARGGNGNVPADARVGEDMPNPPPVANTTQAPTAKGAP